jgi:uncharacterized membrane protein YkoI
MKHRVIPAVWLATALTSSGCGGSSGPGDQRYDPPSTEFAVGLGIETPPPITPDQAMAIAAEATGGTALSVGQETEGGQLLYEVQVRTSSGDKEVEIRASDGGVVEIESADND